MDRTAVYEAINTERNFQESLYKTKGFTSNKSVGEFLTLIRACSAKADAAWASQSFSDSALEEIRKIGALCVACMEQNGAKAKSSHNLVSNITPWSSIAWQVVASSNIHSFRYNPSMTKLQVRFHDSGIYEYDNVPGSVYIGMIAAQSKGKYFHRYVKGNYASKKVA